MSINVFELAGEEICHLISNPKPFYQSTLLSPICRLPDEILASVFFYAVLFWYKGCLDYSDQSEWDHWVKLRQVCRHWDHVIFHWPSLWSHVVPVSSKLRFTEISLSRSKQLPLKICINARCSRGQKKNDWSPPPGDLLEKLGHHGERIQELALNHGNAAKILFQLFTMPSSSSSGASMRAPHLQNLTIARDENVPLEPLNLDAPVLRVLHLHECPASWRSKFIQTGLTSLSLSRIPSSCQQDVVEFLADLSRMQNLEHLSLDNALPSARGFISSPAFLAYESRSVTLPHLSRLLIAAPMSTIFTLLWHIDFPTKAELRVAIICELDDEYNHTLITSLVSDLITRVETTQDHIRSTRSLAIASTVGSTPSSLALRLAGFGSSNSDLDCMAVRKCYDSLNPSRLDPEWGCNVPLKIVISLSSTLSQWNGFRKLSDLCFALPLSMFHYVCVVNPPFTSIFWKKLLRQLINVRCLELREGCMPDLAAALSSFESEYSNINPAGSEGNAGPLTHSRNNSTSAAFIAPALQDVRLVSIDSGKKAHQDTWKAEWVPDGPLTSHGTADIQSLCAALASRKLRLTQAGITSEAWPDILMDNRA